MDQTRSKHCCCSSEFRVFSHWVLMCVLWFSFVFLCSPYVVRMRFLSVFYAARMVSLCFSYAFPMRTYPLFFLCVSYGLRSVPDVFSMCFLMFSSVVLMRFLRLLYVFPTCLMFSQVVPILLFPTRSFVFHPIFLCLSYVFPVFSCCVPMLFPCFSYMFPVLFACGRG